PHLDDGPLIVKPYLGAGGHHVHIVRTAVELAAVPLNRREPVFAQRYHPPEGRDRKIYAIGTELFGVKKIFPRRTDADKPGEPFDVGARLFDAEPGKIVRRLARRDASSHSDEFRVLLDSYHDYRTAFEFTVNAAGVHTDVLYGGDGSFSDKSWDPVWEAATTVDSLGWTAEIRIPFTQLRFAKAAEQVWGVRFVRWIERKNELALYPFVARTESGMASRFAYLVGLAGLETRQHLQILPYAVGSGTYRQ